MKTRKPPLGLVPEYVRRLQRILEISDAIQRYCEVGKRVPRMWLQEYEGLVRMCEKEET